MVPVFSEILEDELQEAILLYSFYCGEEQFEPICCTANPDLDFQLCQFPKQA